MCFRRRRRHTHRFATGEYAHDSPELAMTAWKLRCLRYLSLPPIAQLVLDERVALADWQAQSRSWLSFSHASISGLGTDVVDMTSNVTTIDEHSVQHQCRRLYKASNLTTAGDEYPFDWWLLCWSSASAEALNLPAQSSATSVHQSAEAVELPHGRPRLQF